MLEKRGLQIEVRCVRCGKLPTAENELYEMQNHLYLCQSCRQQAEAQGKRISWAGDPEQLASMPAATGNLVSPKAKATNSNLPPDSIFALLELPLNTPVVQLKAAIKQQAAAWMREPDKKDLVARLREWQTRLLAEDEFEAYRSSLQPQRKESRALSVGGQLVTTPEEFVNACEARAEGWADGERYLRTGLLRQWIVFQFDDREMAAKARIYQNWEEVSDFRALNAMLYSMLLTRPFRFYQEERWQPVNAIASANSPTELAELCDKNWFPGEKHLYEGSMLYWLEFAQGVKGLMEYYDACIKGYANMKSERGVGLELVLERAVPTLEKPQLEVTFDGEIGSCTIKPWDRELPHRPVTVTITNKTRGYMKLLVELEQKHSPTMPDWILLNPHATQHFWGTPGNGLPVNRTLSLVNLPQLDRGRTYRRALRISTVGEYNKAPEVQTFPITLKTMSFWQGLRGILWAWGLRGGIPALFWNAIAGTALSFLVFHLVETLFSRSLSSPLHNGSSLSFSTLLDASLAGMVQTLTALGNTAIWSMALIGGVVGFCVGIGKGHMNYPQGKNAQRFRTGTFWLVLLAVVVLLSKDQGWTVLGEALQFGGRFIPAAFYIVLGDILLGTLAFLIFCLLAFFHSLLEKFLRRRYEKLLHPVGRG
ncbi:MAG TPA: hypothetical protein VKY19_21835 [Ktedonosporobacter sp.]|jgi:hypothetical protein|nr:hypothetical protein [Ktedonosporobacter sp.]